VNEEDWGDEVTLDILNTGASFPSPLKLQMQVSDPGEYQTDIIFSPFDWTNLVGTNK
jgi:hypothetical protein